MAGSKRAKRGSSRDTSRIESIYRSIFQAILSQELAPGTKLSEESIGQLFGVSRTIVRAVLNRLKSNSLVEFKPNRGAFVATPTLAESRQVFDARICIEREIAALVARGIDEKKLDLLKRHVAKAQKAFNAGDTAETVRLSG